MFLGQQVLVKIAKKIKSHNQNYTGSAAQGREVQLMDCFFFEDRRNMCMVVCVNNLMVFLYWEVEMVL
jgi:hypothetical protein